MQIYQRDPNGKTYSLAATAVPDVAYMPLRGSNASRDFLLSPAARLKIGNEFVPVHNRIIAFALEIASANAIMILITIAI